MYKYVPVFILLICAQKALTQQQQQKVHVTVYYESLCPDSMKFFTRQLYPALQGNLSQYIELNLIPFGRATQTHTIESGWQFECHHGPNECYGNRIQACAITKIPNLNPNPKQSANLGYNKVLVAFINCLMDKVERDPFKLPVQDCATLNNVFNYADIENCANHTDGTQLLANLGHMTEKLQPKLQSVPTIVFNNVYNKNDNDLSQTNFPKALCSYIRGTKPAECSRNAAHIPTFNTILSLITVLVLLPITHMF